MGLSTRVCLTFVVAVAASVLGVSRASPDPAGGVALSVTESGPAWVTSDYRVAVTVTNTGSTTSGSVVVSETLDSGEHYVATNISPGGGGCGNGVPSGAVATCEIGMLSPGAHALIAFDVHVDVPPASGVLNHSISATDGTASALGSASHPYRDPSVTDVYPTFKQFFAASTPATVGVEWAIVNDGPHVADDTSVHLTSTVPIVGLQATAGQPGGYSVPGTCDVATATCQLGTISDAQVIMYVDAPIGVDETYGLHVSTSTPDANPANDSLTATYTLCCPPAGGGGGGEIGRAHV